MRVPIIYHKFNPLKLYERLPLTITKYTFILRNMFLVKQKNMFSLFIYLFF